jgi:uncharacterized protein YbcI
MTDELRDPRTLPRSPAQTISNGMVGLISRHTGRGPTHARAALNSNFVLVSFHDVLTRAEQNLVEAGQSEIVLSMRRTFHEVMQKEAIELVEETLDRQVESLLSDLDPEAGVAVMVFLLDRVAETGLLEVAEVGQP